MDGRGKREGAGSGWEQLSVHLPRGCPGGVVPRCSLHFWGPPGLGDGEGKVVGSYMYLGFWRPPGVREGEAAGSGGGGKGVGSGCAQLLVELFPRCMFLLILNFGGPLG